MIRLGAQCMIRAGSAAPSAGSSEALGFYSKLHCLCLGQLGILVDSGLSGGSLASWLHKALCTLSSSFFPVRYLGQ